MSDPTDKAKARFELLRRLGAGSSAYVDPELDALAAHAADIAGAPVGLVTFLDEDRQWLAGEHGFGRRETPLEWSFCRHAIVRAEAGLWVVGDAFLEPLVKDTALVQAERPVRFYAGVVIETHDHIPLGAVCVIDYEPRTLDQRTERTLRLLAREVATHLELRLSRQSLRRPTGIHDPAHPTPGGWDPRHARFFYATPQPMWVFDVETLSFLAVNDASLQRGVEFAEVFEANVHRVAGGFGDAMHRPCQSLETIAWHQLRRRLPKGLSSENAGIATS
ncbi:MAG TPA: GAF domain-containing protein, partial [Myxococcota bacterium]|nr:GAF domain-containing protein [Myxococcota bacterium]